MRLYASVYINTDPEFSDVYINGQFKGITPLEIRELPLGKYRLRVVHLSAGEATSVLEISSQKAVKHTIGFKNLRSKPVKSEDFSFTFKEPNYSKSSSVFTVLALGLLLVLGSTATHLDVIK